MLSATIIFRVLDPVSYDSEMGTVRSPGQNLLPISIDERFIAQIDDGFPQAGYASRSDFIREAISEKLARMGIQVPTLSPEPPPGPALEADQPTANGAIRKKCKTPQKPQQKA